jgi:hypothetical protein
VPATYVRLIEVDLLPGERVANAAVPHLTGSVTNRLRATVEYRFLGRNFIEFAYRRWDDRHPDGFITEPLGLGRPLVPSARFSDQDVLINSSIVGREHTYLATSTFIHSGTGADPNVHGEFGAGIERLPDPTKNASLFGSYFYYPEVTGTIGVPAGVPGGRLRYKVENYDLGGTLAIPHEPLFLAAGFAGNHYLRKQNAVLGETHATAVLGLGVHL